MTCTSRQVGRGHDCDAKLAFLLRQKAQTKRASHAQFRGSCILMIRPGLHCTSVLLLASWLTAIWIRRAPLDAP